MPESMDEKILGGLAALITVFVVGCVFGRVSGDNTTNKMTGDRVMSGLIALPLISLAVHYALPKDVNIVWAIIAPVPLAIYVLLLAGSDDTLTKLPWHDRAKNRFVETLLLTIGSFYVIIAVTLLVRDHAR